MGAHGGRPDGHRGAARQALVVAVVLAAVALVTGVGAAAPARSGPVPAATPAVIPVPPLPPCPPPARACVDLATAHAWLLDAGRVVRGPVRITAGHETTPTPRGEFAVQWKARTYTSREYDRPSPGRCSSPRAASPSTRAARTRSRPAA
jgi:hypothetical protein